jgi:hypothetical protein
MITVNDTFWKFRTRLETTDTEDATASRRQQSSATNSTKPSTSSRTS